MYKEASVTTAAISASAIFYNCILRQKIGLNNEMF